MKYDCPSCRTPFNGKKCKHCGYESFDEEFAHRMHVHKGEPLVIKDTQRRPLPTQDPFGCPPKQKKRGITPNTVVWICCILSTLMYVLRKVPALNQPVPNVVEMFRNLLSALLS